ncbi:MAG: ABC transporter ATP-binding protein/permease [Beijerinckiaceae bacterium]
MRLLSVCVAATALVLLLMGFRGPVNAVTLGLGAVGLALAFVTARAPAISTFLRIFAGIFAVEYVLTGLAYAVVFAGFWPAGLAEATPPASLPFTIAAFGLIVYGISFIPVIRQITRLADPYFEAPEKLEGQAGLFRRWFASERTLAHALLVAVVVINQIQVGIGLRISFVNRDLFDALNKKDSASFWYLLGVVFVMWAIIAVISNLIEYYVESVLKIRWRRWLTERYYSRWLDNGTHYRMGLGGVDTDNPDQRIAEDVRGYLNSTYAYSITLLSQISNLVSFSILLWTIPAQFAIPGTDIVIPGLPFWVALAYSLIGTWLTHKIGRPLVKLDFAQERYEADFRYSLARLREYTEQTALLRGETVEKRRLADTFSAVIDNFFRLVSRNLKLSAFTSSWFQASVVFPYAIVAPYYFSGALSLGQLTQTAGAFSRVEGALSFFIARYASLANFKAIIDRLTTFGAAIHAAQALGTTPPRIDVVQAPTDALSLKKLALHLPNGKTIVRVEDMHLPSGGATLFTGPSGSGKSTLFRAIAGIWPYGEGTILTPQGKSVLLLPQRPYLPTGSLRVAVSYPALEGSYPDAAIAAALEAVKLPHLTAQLDHDDIWAQRLSGGEQQRLAIARALLAKPDWLFLDEATASLDEPLEKAIYETLRTLLPGTTIISIGHRSTLIDMHGGRIVMEPNSDGTFTPSLK